MYRAYLCAALKKYFGDLHRAVRIPVFLIFVSNSSVLLRMSLASAQKRAVSVSENVFDCSSAVEERSHQLIYLRAYKNDIETMEKWCEIKGKVEIQITK